MTLSEELQWRGQIKDKTFDDITWLDEPKTFYLGVDCSGPSMQIGNLALFILARRLLDSGWKTILLVGGATSLIGDPGGKDSERDLKPREEIEANVASIKSQVERLFDGKEFTLVDNFDWFKDVGYLEFLRDVGKHYSMTELIQRDYIATRLGEGGGGISYAEFSYSLIQGYDFWHLFKSHNVVLQIGGSDQWGNMLSGVPLIRKKDNAEVHAMSAPLVINKSTGVKFGKSEEGAVFLDPQMTSVYKFYQFWLNVDDEGVTDYLKIYTLLAKSEIEEILDEFNSNRASRNAQKALAYEVTKLVHGQERADSVKRATETLFGGNDYSQLQKADFEMLAKELPQAMGFVGNMLGNTLLEVGLASSMSEVRRFFDQGAIYLNGRQLTEDVAISDDDNLGSGYAVLKRGKNAMSLLQIVHHPH
jgi:tyrosyl-tRNA synthetase